MSSQRIKQLEMALRDAISTYKGSDKLVSAERIEAWEHALADDKAIGKYPDLELPSELERMREQLFRMRAQLFHVSDELSEAKKDKARLDWLADPKNTIGNVTLPREHIMNHPESMRAAIDAAMEGDK
jgi:hypothetical protein